MLKWLGDTRTRESPGHLRVGDDFAHRYPGGAQGWGSALRLGDDVLRLLVQPPAAPHGMPEFPAAGPLAEGHLAHQRGADPMGIGRVRSRHVIERRALAG